ncbi:hypothetical protein E2542_SST02496 [Spatholobus suberectus]|nr:hypothetical protein E2542_SST02496 [Spatholobus suberectus]
MMVSVPQGLKLIIAFERKTAQKNYSRILLHTEMDTRDFVFIVLLLISVIDVNKCDVWVYILSVWVRKNMYKQKNAGSEQILLTIKSAKKNSNHPNMNKHQLF